MLARLLLGLVLLARAARADVTVQATVEPSRAQVGQSVAFDVRIDGVQNAPAPELQAVDGLELRYLGPSTKVEIVNGQVSQSITHRFSAVGSRPGTFTIGPAGVTLGGTCYQAAAVTLNVVAPGTPPPAPPAGLAAAPAGGEQLQLVLSAAKKEVYLHERVPFRLELWIGKVRVSDLHYPSVPGDGVSIEKLPQQPAQRREKTADGAFQVVEFASTLSALRAGTLMVGPATMSLTQLVRSTRGDPLFGFFGETEKPVELHSEPLVLTVLPLPDEGRPADYAGAVGRFEFDVKAGPLDLGVGDPVTVTTTLRGEGNLESIAPPAIAASDALRVYPLQQSGDATAGQRTFEQVVIPQRAGTTTLPETRFSYFDPEARAYRTIVHPPITLAVRAGAPAGNAPQIVGAAVPRTAAEKLGRDLVFIKDDPGTLAPIGAQRHRSRAFWAFQALPLVVWLLALVYDRRRRRLTGDLRYARFTRAGRAARHALAGARQKLGRGDHAAFYDALARAVSEYLAAKLDLPPGGVAVDTVGERLRAHGVSPNVARELEEFFRVCEHARFAPTADASGDMQRTLDRADAIVRALERERRLGRAVAAACLLLAVAARVSAATPGESPKTLFFRANSLYTEEHYAEAAAQYEQIAGEGLASGNLYFNLGNAYFKAGDVGRAILNYERARRLIPGDPDLLANLGFARSLAGGADEPPLWQRLFFPFAERFASDSLLLVASGLYGLLVLFLIGARLLDRAGRALRTAAVATAVALALLLPSLVYRLATVDLPTYAVVVTKDEATVRFEPSAAGTQHFQAKPGSVVRVRAERQGWMQVVRPDGRQGWVESGSLALI
jgi:tetratricopeptide (TPR) repeat protein